MIDDWFCLGFTCSHFSGIVDKKTSCYAPQICQFEVLHCKITFSSLIVRISAYSSCASGLRTGPFTKACGSQDNKVDEGRSRAVTESNFFRPHHASGWTCPTLG